MFYCCVIFFCVPISHFIYPSNSCWTLGCFHFGAIMNTDAMGRFPEKEMQPTSVFLLGESYGQRSLAGYRPWGHKESDMTEYSTERHSTHEYASFCAAIFPFLLDGHLRVSGTAESYGNCMFNCIWNGKTVLQSLTILHPH